MEKKIIYLYNVLRLKWFISDVEVRLTGEDVRHVGRVEIKYKGVWGTVSNQGWDKTDAHVVCRQLGYHYALQTEIMSATQKFVAQPVWFSDVSCNGTEISILDCNVSIVAGQQWLHDSDVGVVCQVNETVGEW